MGDALLCPHHMLLLRGCNMCGHLSFMLAVEWLQESSGVRSLLLHDELSPLPSPVANRQNLGGLAATVVGRRSEGCVTGCCCCAETGNVRPGICGPYRRVSTLATLAVRAHACFEAICGYWGPRGLLQLQLCASHVTISTNLNRTTTICNAPF